MPLKLGPENIGAYLAWWHGERHRARTDLLWLCNVVLGYVDVSREVHGPILDALQWFPGADEYHKTVADLAAAHGGKVMWKPGCKMELLPPNPGFLQSRDNQFLYPRGHLKSTVITVAHSIQWILNYPNVRLLVTTATETLVQNFVIQVRDQFRMNDQLRLLFPELCPQSKDGKIPELGNLSGFTCPARDNGNKDLGPGGKEPTVQASTVGSAITGYHGDVQKSDDLVEKINSASQGGIDDVIRHFGSMGDLLEKYNSDDPERPLKGWQDVVGTPWDFSDLYQVRRNQQEELASKGLPPTVNMIIRSAAPNWPDGPYLWPQRMGYKALKEIEDDPTKGPSQLAAQYLMNPIIVGTGLVDDIRELMWKPAAEIEELLPGAMLCAALDLAGMDAGAKGVDNDRTCLTVGGWRDGRLMIPWMMYGRPAPEEVIAWIFHAFEKFPELTKLKIEKEAHARVLLPFLQKEMSRRAEAGEKVAWLPIEATPRNNQQSKKDKIRGTRPWWKSGAIWLSDSLPYRTAIETEIKGFPKYRHDDFLDTVTDLMHEARGVSAGVLVDHQEFAVPVHHASPLDALLARMDVEFDPAWGGNQQYDAVTGFPL